MSCANNECSNKSCMGKNCEHEHILTSERNETRQYDWRVHTCDENGNQLVVVVECEYCDITGYEFGYYDVNDQYKVIKGSLNFYEALEVMSDIENMQYDLS